MQPKSRYFRRSRVIIAVVVVVLVASGAWLRWRGMPGAAWDALTTADQLELYSLKPDDIAGNLDRFTVLGKTTVSNSQQRVKLRDALQSGVRQSDGTMYRCFNPRHGIRVTKNGVVTDFVICFECGRVQVWRGDQRLAYFAVTKSPQPAFDAVLNAAGVPLPPKEE